MNTLKLFLKIPVDEQHYLNGTFANVVKDFPIYVGSYNTIEVKVYVPKQMLNTDDGYSNAVNMAGKFTLANGAELVTNAYWFSQVEDEVVNNKLYAVFSRIMPQKLTEYAGMQLFIVNLSVMDLSDPSNPIFDHITTTQEVNVLIQRSAYISTDEGLEPSQLDQVNARLTSVEEDVTELQTDVSDLQGRMTTAEGNIESNTSRIQTLENTISTGEDYIGTYTNSLVPFNPSGEVIISSELTAYVKSVRGNDYDLENGDTVIYIQTIAGATDRNYKMIYGLTGWTGYEIPPIEVANNGSLGLVKGTYGVDDGTTLVSINNGKIERVYVKTNGSYITLEDIASNVDVATKYSKVALRSISDSLGNNIVDTYLTKTLGATKQFVRDYALPREFNDVYYYTSGGLTRTAPSGNVQFSQTIQHLGDTEVFDLSLMTNATFELSKNNGYTSTIWFNLDKSTTIQFRLTTYAKKSEDSDWTLLYADLSQPINVTANELSKIDFSHSFTQLNSNVLVMSEGDLLRQRLEIVTESNESMVLNILGGDVVQSTFNLVITGVRVNSYDVIDNLTSTDRYSPLSANQGRVLDEKIKQKVSVEIDDYETLSFINN